MRQLQAHPSNALAESVGVNVHLAYTPSNYRELDPVQGRDDQWPGVAAALANLGVRYIRDHVPDEAAVEAQLVRLRQDEGVRASLIVPPPGHKPLNDIIAVLRRLADLDVLASIEAPNEPDNPPSQFDPEPWQQYQEQLHAALKADPVLAPVPLLVPPLVSEQGHTRLGDLTRYADQGNIHPYAIAAPYRPEALAIYLDWAKWVSGDLPLQATETGYCSPLTPADDFGAWCGVSARAAGAYLPKTLLTNFAHGIARTYVYELLDEMLERDLTGPSHDPAFAQMLRDPRYHQGRFGLLEHDFTPKPAGIAVRNLMSLTMDAASEVDPTPLGIEIGGVDGGAENVRTLLLQRSDGDHLLFLWQDVDLYQPELDALGRRQVPRDVYPPAASLSISLSRAHSSLVHHLGVSRLPIAAIGSGTQMDVELPADDVVVLRLAQDG